MMLFVGCHCTLKFIGIYKFIQKFKSPNTIDCELGKKWKKSMTDTVGSHCL